MMISLNASMRNTLLSLRNISAQQDNMQLILSTGKKVNSAIDNPSSYYQATSLTNRAADLLNLLNSMEQGIQTIQAANTGVDTALNLLEQMEAIANQAGTQAPNVPSKEYFENLVGANGAVVTTAEELRNAIAANKETICIYGAIDLGDISTSGGLELKANQKLVGIGYFGNFDSDIGKFSSITATDSRNKGSLINVTQNNCLVDGLSLNYTNMIEDGNAYVLYVDGTNITTDICNLDIQANFSDINTSKTRAAIRSSTGATVNVDGDININTEGREGHGFLAFGDAKININAGAKVKIQTQGASSYGLYSHSRSTIEVNQGTMVDIKSLGTGTGVLLMNEAVVNISGKLAITTTSSAANGIRLSPEVVSYKSNNRVTIDATAEVYFNTVGEEIMNAYSKNNTPNVIEFAKGAKIAFHKNGVTSWYQIQENGKDENTSTNKLSYVNASNITQKLNVSQTSDWKLPSAEINFSSSKNNIVFLNEQKKQFNDALSQYDQLIKDSSI